MPEPRESARASAPARSVGFECRSGAEPAPSDLAEPGAGPCCKGHSDGGQAQGRKARAVSGSGAGVVPGGGEITSRRRLRQKANHLNKHDFETPVVIRAAGAPVAAQAAIRGLLPGGRTTCRARGGTRRPAAPPGPLIGLCCPGRRVGPWRSVRLPKAWATCETVLSRRCVGGCPWRLRVAQGDRRRFAPGRARRFAHVACAPAPPDCGAGRPPFRGNARLSAKGGVASRHVRHARCCGFNREVS
jgi:hypothetical protein